MKKTIAFLFTAVSLASCQEEHPAKFTVRLKDDQGKPVEGYTIHSGTLDYEASLRKGDPSKNDPVWTDVTAQTDARGEAVFEYMTLTGMVGINLSQGLTGNYYLTGIENYQFEKVRDSRWVPENPVIETVLKRKLNPIPMYAKDLRSGLAVPHKGEPCAYDFEVGDWMPPDGKGRHPDIVFIADSEDKGGGDFTSLVKISFPNKGDGLIRFLAEPDQGKDCLKSAHMAPIDGYQPEAKYFRNRENGSISTNLETEANYYLRTRTVLDNNGKIISANYSKLYGEFMYFSYYYNPVPNDRNIEFDTARNLFSKAGSTPSPYEP